MSLTGTAAGHDTFAALLTSQPWDLVIVDVSDARISAINSSALIGDIDGGGRVVLSYFDLDVNAPLAAAFDAMAIAFVAASGAGLARLWSATTGASS